MKSMLVMAAVFVCGSHAAAGVQSTLFSQPNDRTAQASFFSDAVPGQFFSSRMADNFTVAGNSSVEAVRFWGGSQNFQFADINNMTGWTVRIYEGDGFGGIGTELGSTEATISNMTLAPTGETIFGGGLQYEHTVTLDAPIALSPGTEYWFSVGATLSDPFADAWVWSGSTVGDLTNATDYFDGAGFIRFDNSFNDLAFEILGVPTPGTVALFGFAGLAGVRRRR